MSQTVKTITEEALGFQRAKGLWTSLYTPALPFTPLDYDIGALLPAMLYMARWGHRRGKGNFVTSFGLSFNGKSQPPNIAQVASVLQARVESGLDGFDGTTGKAVLGDLLLAWCLENKGHAEGQQEQVQRIYPTHYLASWIDLPKDLANLRGVPEFLTSLLANQSTMEWLEAGGQGHFPVGTTSHRDNQLLRLFARAMTIRGAYASDLASDSFVEESADEIGIDELLAVRLAQACGSAPLKAKGKNESERIPNRHPIACAAAEALREDLAVFIEVFGLSIPRQSFLHMLEAGIALGMTNLTLSTLNQLLAWEQQGTLPQTSEQSPWPLFVDASHGQDKALREISEAVMTETVRRYERLPVLMGLLRVLDDQVRNDRKLRDQLPPTWPDSTTFINLLGEIYLERHPRAEAILDALDEDCQRLAEGLEQAGEAGEVAERLRRGQGSPALRLAEAICELMGDVQRKNYMGAFDSAFMPDRSNGLAIKRRVRRSQNGTQRTQDLRAIVLTPALLDFLVHRHLRKAAKGKPEQSLSFQRFLKLLRERYGLYVDREPPGHPVPQELLLRNKAWMERRLRDLGLLIGVNDAESMKQLRPRYQGEVADAA